MSYEAFRLMVQGWASSGYLPEALAYGFVVNALLAGLLIGPVLGGLGTLVVVKRFAFFSEAVGHAALTGVAIGILLGEPYTAQHIPPRRRKVRPQGGDHAKDGVRLGF